MSYIVNDFAGKSKLQLQGIVSFIKENDYPKREKLIVPSLIFAGFVWEFDVTLHA
jgi:hypothetical protein